MMKVLSGDVVLFRGRHLSSGLIRLFLGGPYSHSGFAGWVNGALYLFEATDDVTPARVVISPLWHRLAAYNGGADLFRLNTRARAELDEATLLQVGLNLEGREFDYSRGIDLALRRATGSGTIGPEKAIPAGTFCSEYVSYCFRMAGVDLVPRVPDAHTTPRDIARSPYLGKIAKLK